MKLLSLIVAVIISANAVPYQKISDHFDRANHNTTLVLKESIIEKKRQDFITECPYYKMLHMSPNDIISEFGGMKFEHGFAGTAPCYSVTGFPSLTLLYLDDGLVMNSPLSEEHIPRRVMMYEESTEILPGIEIGMSSKKFVKLLPIGRLNYSLSDSATGFSSGHIIGDYAITALWGYPEGFYGLEGMYYLYPDNDKKMRDIYTQMYTYAMNKGLVDTPLLGVYISKFKQ